MMHGQTKIKYSMYFIRLMVKEKSLLQHTFPLSACSCTSKPIQNLCGPLLDRTLLHFRWPKFYTRTENVTFIVIVWPFDGFNTNFTRNSTALCLRLQQVTFKSLICIYFIRGSLLSNRSFTECSRHTSKNFFWRGVMVLICKPERCSSDGSVGTVYILTASLQQLPSDVTVVNWSPTHTPTKHRVIYTADTTNACNRLCVLEPCEISL